MKKKQTGTITLEMGIDPMEQKENILNSTDSSLQISKFNKVLLNSSKGSGGSAEEFNTTTGSITQRYSSNSNRTAFPHDKDLNSLLGTGGLKGVPGHKRYDRAQTNEESKGHIYPGPAFIEPISKNPKAHGRKKRHNPHSGHNAHNGGGNNALKV